MNPAIQKTLVFVVLIAVGFLARKKLRDPSQLGGMKMLILSVALPATIFAALLTIHLDVKLLALPFIAVAFNLFLMTATYFILPAMGISRQSGKGRTFMMLFPSLAPGLSCFPYIAEYLGDEPLAWAAVADLGNKVFVLIFLYLLALRWYHQNQEQVKGSGESRFKQLILSLVKEPVNLVILLGLILVSFGIHLSSLPVFLQEAVQRMSTMMTPLVLLFIGLAVVIRPGELGLIMTALLWRAALAFLCGGLLIFLFPGLPHILLAVIFPLSACSFWPYAHMCAIQSMEEKSEKVSESTFDVNLALAILALSLPFSTGLILMVCSFSTFFSEPVHVLSTGSSLLLLATLPLIVHRINFRTAQKAKEITAL